MFEKPSRRDMDRQWLRVVGWRACATLIGAIGLIHAAEAVDNTFEGNLEEAQINMAAVVVAGSFSNAFRLGARDESLELRAMANLQSQEQEFRNIDNQS